jgi:topoisomerase-4 subunit A
MSRGKGVAIQKFHEGGLSDAKTFARNEGLLWVDRAGRTQSVDLWKDYLGKRAQAGRVAPKGFPASRKFGPEPAS